MHSINFWKGKRVLVTGHTGFKGSWLCLFLHHLQADPYGYALDPVKELCLFNASGISNIMQSRIDDINDGDAVQRQFERVKPEIVFHLAAQSIVLNAFEDPVTTFGTNVMGTVNVLEAARQCASVKSILIITTDKVYKEKKEATECSETDELGGVDPYSNSKVGAEMVTAAYYHSYFKRAGVPVKGIATARSGNVIGGGDWADDRIVPDMVRAIVDGDSLVLRYPTAIRPWQHAFDTVSGYLILAQALYNDQYKYSGAWNFGPNQNSTYEVQQIVEMFYRAWGLPAEWEADVQEKAYEQAGLRLNCSKSERLLGHHALYSVHDAIELTVGWYRAFYKEEAMMRLSLQQIDHYLQRNAASAQG